MIIDDDQFEIIAVSVILGCLNANEYLYFCFNVIWLQFFNSILLDIKLVKIHCRNSTNEIN